jgi:hypothetical protein
MSVFMLCERAISFIGGNRLMLTPAQAAMLDALDCAALAAAHAQNEAVTAARHFPFVRDSLLHAYPWTFARRHAAPAELASAPKGWAHAYALPTDCLRMLALVTPGGKAVMRFEAAGAAVFCGEPCASTRYTARIADTALWPPLFADAFCARLAAEMAAAVTGAPGAAAALQQQAVDAVREAYRAGAVKEAPGPEANLYGWDGYSRWDDGGGAL